MARELAPSLVRIETVGGTQPRGAVSLDEDEEGGGPPTPRRIQTPFQDAPGSSFVVADGPTTGIVYSADGYIITSSFNFVREPALVSVTLADGRRLAADLVARDQVRKIALLKVEADGLEVPIWTDDRSVRVGQWAIALGLGLSESHPSISVGIVSALNRMQGLAIQTDAKLSPGNYGGPVCDIYGRILGMAVPMAQRAGELAGVEMYDAGVGFALPKSRIDPIVEVLKTGRSVYRGWLGMSVDPHRMDAVVVARVANPSPLSKVGVLPGDRIVAVDGRPVKHFGQLVQALYLKPAGETVRLLIERDDESFEAIVTLARNTELGPLPEVEEPFDPASPLHENEDPN